MLSALSPSRSKGLPGAYARGQGERVLRTRPLGRLDPGRGGGPSYSRHRLPGFCRMLRNAASHMTREDKAIFKERWDSIANSWDPEKAAADFDQLGRGVARTLQRFHGCHQAQKTLLPDLSRVPESHPRAPVHHERGRNRQQPDRAHPYQQWRLLESPPATSTSNSPWPCPVSQTADGQSPPHASGPFSIVSIFCLLTSSRRRTSHDHPHP